MEWTDILSVGGGSLSGNILSAMDTGLEGDGMGESLSEVSWQAQRYESRVSGRSFGGKISMRTYYCPWASNGDNPGWIFLKRPDLIRTD